MAPASNQTMLLAGAAAVLAPLLVASALPIRDLDQGGRVDALFAQYQNTPGAAVAVIRDGRIVFLKGYGLADVLSKTPISPDTAFDLASVTKPFTAIAILLLEQRGKLALDDPISKTCPEFTGDAKRITIRNLLNHTSGLPDYAAAFMKSGRIGRLVPVSSTLKPSEDEPTAEDTLKLLAKEPKLDFAPGTQFEYSNSGYVVLGQIVERVSGMRFAEFLARNVFRKVGMKKALLADERKQHIPNRAHSYATKNSQIDIDYSPLNRIYGDGNINASARDMAGWLLSLDGEALLTEESRRLAWSAPTLPDGTESDYGFGWVLSHENGEAVVSHEGGWVGFHTVVEYYPSRKLGIVILSNCEEMPVDELCSEIVKIYRIEGRR